MTHQQFVRYCRLLELPEDIYQQVAYPHPYIVIWLECKRHANPWTGVPALPEPERGGILDQDADLMLAFEVLDELQTLREEEEEQRKQRQEAATEFFHPSSS